jgi:gentisate 1,2-dioxygenase
VELERVREREPEAGGTKYDQTLRERAQWVERAMVGQVVIRGAEREYEPNRQGHIKRYLNSKFFHDTALTEWIVFIHDVKRQSGKHRHQGGLVIFVLEGEGSSDVEGLRVDWRPGDLLLLPIKADGVTHQHFNRDPHKGARWMAFIYEPFSRYLMDQIVQVEDMPDEASASLAPLQHLRDASARVGRFAQDGDSYEPLHITNPAQLGSVDLLDELYRLRDHQQRTAERAVWMIQGDQLPWQTSAQGIVRWYLHPAIDYACLHTLLFYVQRIPGGSRSGRQRHGGNAVFYVLEGRGHTILDGVTHSWEAGDLVTLPNRPGGVVYQHFNDDPVSQVLLVACEPDLTHTIGLDRGAGFEQLEACPEYRASHL